MREFKRGDKYFFNDIYDLEQSLSDFKTLLEFLASENDFCLNDGSRQDFDLLMEKFEKYHKKQIKN